MELGSHLFGKETSGLFPWLAESPRASPFTQQTKLGQFGPQMAKASSLAAIALAMQMCTSCRHKAQTFGA
jgi:hypothetical protein